MPQAKYSAASSKVLFLSVEGVCCTVMACISTTQNMQSYLSCNSTQFANAPR